MPPNLRKSWPWLAAVCSGLLLALCYAPWECGSLVWIWAWPLLAALWYSPWNGSPNPLPQPLKPIILRSFLLGYVCGLVFFGVSIHWFYHLWKVVGTRSAGLGAVVGLSMVMATYFGLFSVFAATVGKLVLPQVEKPRTKNQEPRTNHQLSTINYQLFNPTVNKDLFGQSFAVLKVAFLNGACWCGLEWLRGILFTGFPWNTLAMALKDQLMLVQFADVIGMFGYGFVLLFCGVIGFATVLRFAREIRAQQGMRPHLDFAVGVSVVIALFLYGSDKITEPQPEKTVDLDVRILQMNTLNEEKHSPEVKVRQQIILDYRDFSRAFLDHGKHDLLIWPETAIPTVLSWKSTFEFLDNEILKGEDFYLLMGIEDVDVAQRTYNTIALMKEKAASLQVYSKIHLVPFGEYIPGRNWKLPIFKWILGSSISEDFSRGTSYKNLTLEKDGHQIGIMPLVCFEDTLPRHARKFVLNTPQLMVNVTNDGWFYDSAASHQHFAAAIFRCIELRRPMIRAANSGVSAFIDERGSVFDRNSKDTHPRIIQDEATGSTYIRGSLASTVKVDLTPPMTLYSRMGDAFSISMGLIGLGTFVFWVIGERKR